MGKIRTVSRRSFLARVAGCGLAAGAAIVLGGGGALATTRRRTQMIVDADPRDPARPVQAGPARPVGATGSAGRRRSGITVSGAGPNDAASGAGHGALGRIVVCPGNPRCPVRH